MDRIVAQRDEGAPQNPPEASVGRAARLDSNQRPLGPEAVWDSGPVWVSPAFTRPVMSPADPRRAPRGRRDRVPFPKVCPNPDVRETTRPYLMLTILITSNFWILSTTSMPFVTRPITAYLPFRLGFETLRMKNWLSADSGGRPVT